MHNTNMASSRDRTMRVTPRAKKLKALKSVLTLYGGVALDSFGEQDLQVVIPQILADISKLLPNVRFNSLPFTTSNKKSNKKSKKRLRTGQKKKQNSCSNCEALSEKLAACQADSDFLHRYLKHHGFVLKDEHEKLRRAESMRQMWDKIPRDIVSLLTSFLSPQDWGCQLVCWKWWLIRLDPRIWQHAFIEEWDARCALRFARALDPINQATVTKLVRRATFKFQCLIPPCPYFPRLNSLSINYVLQDRHDEGNRIISRQAPLLETLSLAVLHQAPKWDCFLPQLNKLQLDFQGSQWMEEIIENIIAARPPLVELEVNLRHDSGTTTHFWGLCKSLLKLDGLQKLTLIGPSGRSNLNSLERDQELFFSRISALEFDVTSTSSLRTSFFTTYSNLKVLTIALEQYIDLSMSGTHYIGPDTLIVREQSLKSKALEHIRSFWVKMSDILERFPKMATLVFMTTRVVTQEWINTALREVMDSLSKKLQTRSLTLALSITVHRDQLNRVNSGQEMYRMWCKTQLKDLFTSRLVLGEPCFVSRDQGERLNKSFDEMAVYWAVFTSNKA